MKASSKLPHYGQIRSAKDAGQLCRAERKRQGLTQVDLYTSSALSTRFLSEFEHGKEHVSLSKALLALQSLGLDVLVFPRNEAQQLLRLWKHSSEPHDTSKSKP
ncbi:MAG: transcriptional regulator [Myxococcales bacterium]|nr:MAG: transcriptional regulator [Myxococcales bacterium]